MFRYANAEGGFRGLTVMQFTDRHTAEIGAERLMPQGAASVQIWLDDQLISTKSNPQPDTTGG
jgi:hypothetical protein